MEEEREYRCTAGQFDNFIKNDAIWKDMKEELERWLEDARGVLEDTKSELSDRGIFRVQGNVEAIRKCLLLPEGIKANIIADMKRKEKEREE